MDPTPSVPRDEELLVHGRFLRGLARALVSDPERAEDLLQDTWTTAFAHPPKHGTAPRAWLARVLRGLAIKRGLREAERGARERDAALERPAADQPPDALAAEIELSRRVLQSVERLREPYRSTLYLRYYRDLSPQRIAGEQHTPVKTVKTRLARGLELLREDLDRQHGGRRDAWVAVLLPLARGTPAPLPPLEVAAPAASSGVLVSLAIAGLVVAGASAWWLLGTSEGTRAPTPSPPSLARTERVPSPVPGPPAESARIPVGEAAQSPSAAAHQIRLRGRVVDATGVPVVAARVRASVLEVERVGRGEGPADPLAPFGGELLGAPGRTPEPGASTSTDARGRFALELDEVGLVRLGVESPGLTPLGRRFPGFEGQELDLGDLVLDPGVLLAGRVLGPDGTPVPAAEVWQTRDDDGWTLGSDLVHQELVATSDAQGRFRIECQAVGPWSLEARAAGFAPAWASGTTSEAGEGPEDLVLALGDGATLRGRVRGLTPEQTARVRVLARAVEGDDVHLAALDERGGFEWTGLARGAELEVVPLLEEAGRRRPLARPQVARAGVDELEFLIDPTEPRARPERSRADGPNASGAGTGSVTVRVVAPGGASTSGVLVACRRVDADGRGPRRGEVRATGRDGSLAWDDLASGPYEFRVVDDAFGGLGPRGEWVQLRVEGGARAELELPSLPAVELEGVARLDRAPLVRAEILLRPSEGEGGAGADASSRGDRRRVRAPALLARTDSEGRFAFRGLAPGTYRLELRHPRRALPEERTLEVTGTRMEIDLELTGLSLRGEVRDREGSPIAGARVRARAAEGLGARERWGEGGDEEPGTVHTGADGSFELLGLEPGRAARLEVRAPGYARAAVRGAPEDFLQVVLEPEAVLVLELVSAGPASGRRPRLLVARGPGERELVLPVTPGVTRIDGLARGSWRLTLEGAFGRGGRGSEGEEERAVELQAGENSLRWVLPD